MDVPAVWVIQTVGSRPDHECVLGDGLAKWLCSMGCRGAVTNGRVRDLDGLLSVPFAAYARGTGIHHCHWRFRAIDVPVQVGGITVSPGDIIHGCAEGVIKIPPASIAAPIDAAPRMRAFEHEAHALYRRTGLSFAETRLRRSQLVVKYGFGEG